MGQETGAVQSPLACAPANALSARWMDRTVDEAVFAFSMQTAPLSISIHISASMSNESVRRI